MTATATKAVTSGGGSDTGSSFCKVANAEKAQEAQEEQALTGGAASLEQFEKKALSELPAFESIAPSQIKGPVTVVVNADRTLFSALQAANFDPTKMPPSVLASLETPAFTNATQQIDTYLASACGITEPTTPTT